MRPKKVEDAEELVSDPRSRAHELENDDVDALGEAAQEELGDELPAGR
jgi:hypothetical protein